MTVDFADYFWGEKNNGFDVLYHNMKFGLVASKELSDFLREKSNIEDHNSKLMSKLAHKAGSGTLNGTFAPVWVILRSSAERLSTLHLQMVQKLTELVKNVTKYTDELHKKHKTVKEDESGTLDIVQAMQASTAAVQKSKDLYQSKVQELEKLRKDNGSPKDIEKAEAKFKKLKDDYKSLMDKHNPIKIEFERKMALTCRKFQTIEEAHLRQMREFLSTYLELLQNNHDMIGQIHSDFKRQFLEMTVDKLLEQFVLNKYTGLEKPDIPELDLVRWSPNSKQKDQNQTQNNTPPNISSNTVVEHSINKSEVSLTTFDNEITSGINVTSNKTNTRSQSPEPIQTTTTTNRRELNLRSWFTSNIPSSGRAEKLTNTTIDTSQGQDIQSSFISPALSQLSEQTSPTPKQGQQQIQHTSSKEHRHQQQQQQQQQKSSRRTTSLLNLFMSNSQGKNEAQPSFEVLSAPSSPSEQSASQNSSQIGRNPLLRGSKFSGILRSRREKAKTKKIKKKKDNDSSNTKDEKSCVADVKEEVQKSQATPLQTPELISTVSNLSGKAPKATTEVDEDGYSVQPRKESAWEDVHEKGSFYSSSDTDSDDEKPERKIHVEIKPLNNGTAPISASVDELRATVGNISLSPIGAFSHSQNLQTNTNGVSVHQSPEASNASTPTTVHPYAPLQSPTLSVSNTSRYADLGDLFSEIGDFSSSAPVSATLSKVNSRHVSTPTSVSSIAIPRPPSRRSEAMRGRISPSSISRADSVGSMEFRTGVGIGSSRGPSPLTIGLTDTIPLAVAFHEIIHAYFRGSDESRCQVKMSGDMMLSFPAGIVGVLANNPNPAKLGFRIKNVQNLDNITPNKQLVQVDKLQSTTFSTLLEFNMNALTSLLRRQSEQNPNASYFNVDILKYQIKSKPGASSCPFQLVSYWKCEPLHTALKIDYKYNSHAMSLPSPLLNVTISVPVDGGVKNVQSKPHSAWLGESNRLTWNFTDISQHSESGGVGTLRARLEVNSGPSTQSTLSVQFNCEGTTLSGIEFELVGTGYRLSLVKRRFISGKYICEGEGVRSTKTPTPPIVDSSSPFLSKLSG